MKVSSPSVTRAVIIAVLLAVLPLSGCLTSGIKEGKAQAPENPAGGIAVEACVLLCTEQLSGGADFSEGPCLSNRIEGAEGWVCDIVHKPRQEADNNPENQCSAFREGRASHFVELDPSCGVITVY